MHAYELRLSRKNWPGDTLRQCDTISVHFDWLKVVLPKVVGVGNRDDDRGPEC